MSLEKKIENVLNENFKVNHLEVINESYMHSGPDDAETHFKVIMVSEDFINLKLIERHRSINELMKDQFSNGLNALSLHLFTTSEWSKKGEKVKESPPCAK